jgi:hypothetical protein
VTRLSLHGDYSTVREQALFQIFDLTVTLLAARSRLSIPFVPFSMLWNSRTRSRVRALGNASACLRLIQLSGIMLCRTAWKQAIVYHYSLLLHDFAGPVQLRLSAAVIYFRVMWPRVYHQRARAHTHGTLHLRSQHVACSL